MSKRLRFEVSHLPHPDPNHIGSRLHLFAKLTKYEANEMVFEMREGANVEVVKDMVSTYTQSRNAKVTNIVEE